MSRITGFLATLVCLSALFVSCGSSGGGGGVFTPEIDGSMVFVDENRTLTGCTGVHLLGVGVVYLRQGPTESLMVRGEDNLLPYITTTVQGGILEIREDPTVDLNPTRPIEYHITAPSMTSVVLTGVGTIEGLSLDLDRLTLQGTGVGQMRFTDLDANQLDVTISGVIGLDMSGSVHRQDLDLDGVGDYQAQALSSHIVNATLSGHGSATVSVSDQLTVTINSSGSLYYVGSPTVQSTINGTGQVQQIGS